LSSGAARRLAWAAGPALAVLSLGFALLLAEGLLRAFPERLLPQGTYGSGRFDTELGLSVAASPVYYQNVRFVRKQPNPSGFMDVAHELEKPPGTVRVGFFGDSYVESNQVALEQAFFRRLPERIEGRSVEPLAFGVSGWGTLHAFLAFQREAPRYGLDRAVYLFVENDPADNCYVLSGHRGVTALPYAESSEAPPGYSLRWSRRPGDEPGWLPAAKSLQRRSLLFQLTLARYRLLRDRGVRMRARSEDVQMTGRGNPKADPAALPAAWPPALRTEAERLGRAILADWKARADAEGIALEILYVPRGDEQLRGKLAEADTWLPWLRREAADLGIPLLDPSRALQGRLERGDPVYDDHWSPAGHEVVAALLAEDLGRALRAPR
jgi:hypothetical protein